MAPTSDSTNHSYDAQLEPLLCASRQAFEEAVQRLVHDVAQPIIRRTVAAKLRPWQSGGNLGMFEVEDLCSEALLQVLRRLEDFRQAPQEKGIHNFQNYVAVVSFRVCSDYFRAKFPARFGFKNKVLYILENNQSIRLGENPDGNLFCVSLKHPVNSKSEKTPAARKEQFLAQPVETATEIFPGQAPSALSLAECLTGILDWIGKPIEVDELVAALAVVQQVELRQTMLALEEQELDKGRRPVCAPAPKPIERLVNQEFLKRLWSEIRQLSPRQCAALLLNLREPDGGSALELFFLTGIAQPAEVAACLELTSTQFSDIWHKIPLDDTTIGEMIGATRQQVINLRKCARERLARRMKND
ncbi:MAG: hypothetical protein K1Y36_25900 [Blastocatellia bacterium]|nr:hypothetical protein [Blastocatellia bacterium]